MTAGQSDSNNWFARVNCLGEDIGAEREGAETVKHIFGRIEKKVLELQLEALLPKVYFWIWSVTWGGRSTAVSGARLGNTVLPSIIFFLDLRLESSPDGQDSESPSPRQRKQIHA